MTDKVQHQAGVERPWPHHNHPGKYEEIGATIGCLVDKKQKAYGRSFETCEKALALLCPDKIRPDQYGLVLVFARSWDKWSRIFADPTAFGEEPRKDLAGYALLMNRDYPIDELKEVGDK
jgi:hypothetical protein